MISYRRLRSAIMADGPVDASTAVSAEATRRGLRFASVQSTLLYGSKTWDEALQVLKALSGFHHRVPGRTIGLTPESRMPSG
jgi:hypothetical protein